MRCYFQKYVCIGKILENALIQEINMLNLSLHKMQIKQYLKKLQSARILNFWVKLLEQTWEACL